MGLGVQNTPIQKTQRNMFCQIFLQDTHPSVIHMCPNLPPSPGMWRIAAVPPSLPSSVDASDPKSKILVLLGTG